jgi:hypothetical protein
LSETITAVMRELLVPGYTPGPASATREIRVFSTVIRRRVRLVDGPRDSGSKCSSAAGAVTSKEVH